MNTIVVLLDSLNWHCLSAYGSTPVQTPNLQRFADRACVFDNHFAGSMPCMPARRELFTGRQEFLWRGWGHLEPWDRHIAVDAARAGFVTQMVTDHYHYWENGAHGYFEPFNGVEFIRGHENDMWQTDPVEDPPPWAQGINRYRHGPVRNYEGWGTAYYANRRRWQEESQFPCARVMQRSAEWLRDNHTHDKTFLWVECFDPHEPHYLPEPYRSMYVQGTVPPDYNCWPPYQQREECLRFAMEASDDELSWIRAQYYGKVTMVDHWLLELFKTMDDRHLWDNTAVIITTDHGHDLCYNRDQGPTIWGKQFPHPESHARIPLMIWHPEYPGQGRRISAMTSAVDVNATVRDLLGDSKPDGPHGRSLLPLLRGETSTHRDYTLSGTFGAGVTLSTPTWILAKGNTGKHPYYWYSTTGLQCSPDMVGGHFIPGVDIPQWRVPFGPHHQSDFLWRRDPFSLTPDNRIASHENVAADMQNMLREAIISVPGPPEALKVFGMEE